MSNNAKLYANDLFLQKQLYIYLLSENSNNV